MIITLAQAKKQLNIEPEFEDDDEYITELIEVAEIVIANDINRVLTDILDSEGQVPAPLKHAAKILIATYYANREAVTAGTVSKTPLSYSALINAYKNFTVG